MATGDSRCGLPLRATLAEAVDDAERKAITVALENSPNDLGRVAESLAISPTTLWRKMKRLGLRAGVEEPLG